MDGCIRNKRGADVASMVNRRMAIGVLMDENRSLKTVGRRLAMMQWLFKSGRAVPSLLRIRVLSLRTVASSKNVIPYDKECSPVLKVRMLPLELRGDSA